MPVPDQEIADKLGRLDDWLEIRGENEFREWASRTAAQTAGPLPRDAHAMLADAESMLADAESMLADAESLSELPAIGEDLAGKIATVVQTDELPPLNEIEEEAPAERREPSGLGVRRGRDAPEGSRPAANF